MHHPPPRPIYKLSVVLTKQNILMFPNEGIFSSHNNDKPRACNNQETQIKLC